MRLKISNLTFICLLGATCLEAHALGIGARASTLGLGMELSQPLARKVTARFGFNGYNYQFEGTESEIDYDLEFKMSSLASLIDWHPMGGGFRISTGLFINGNKVDISSSAQGTYDIGDDSYTGNFNLKGEIDFIPVAPYLGFGWGVRPSKKTGWNMTAEIGVFFHSSPNINLNASGTATREGDNFTLDVSTDPVFQENLSKEEANLRDEFDNQVFYPVASLGFMYSF